MPFSVPDLPAHAALAPLLLLTGIYAAAAVFSGLSGFGFSAIGCLSLLVLPPQLGVAVLMGLSLITQASSVASLWGEMRRYASPWNRPDGILPYLAGGMAGMPIGLRILATSGARGLTATLGMLLVAYAAWSLRRPTAATPAPGGGSPRSSFLVGAAGGVVGGFSAFPGSALVIWNGLIGIGKSQGRALTQPFILCMQLVGLAILTTTHPQLFDRTFWLLFVVALPTALLGNALGVAIYRRTGDVGYRRVTLIALAVSGLGLLGKVVLT